MIKFLLIATSLILLASCGRYASRAEKSSEKTHLSGGFSAQRPLNEADQALFRSLTAELDGVGYTPQSVATQVVAGTNYRFICKAVTVTRKPKSYQAEVTIYKPLPNHGEPRITAIKKL